MRNIARIAILFAAINTPAFAGWIGPYTASYIEISPSGMFISPPSGTTFPNTYQCSNPSFLLITGDSSLISRSVALALSSQSGGSKIKYYVVGCLYGYLNVTQIATDPTW